MKSFKTVDQRLAQARDLHLCTNCLRSGHSNPGCLSKSLCKHCHTRHTFLILNKITENIPLTPIDPAIINIPDNIILADPYFYNSDKVDILLGSEVF